MTFWRCRIEFEAGLAPSSSPATQFRKSEVSFFDSLSSRAERTGAQRVKKALFGHFWHAARIAITFAAQKKKSLKALIFNDFLAMPD